MVCPKHVALAVAGAAAAFAAYQYLQCSSSGSCSGSKPCPKSAPAPASQSEPTKPIIDEERSARIALIELGMELDDAKAVVKATSVSLTRAVEALQATNGDIEKAIAGIKNNTIGPNMALKNHGGTTMESIAM
eukprot:TRINITY_DN1197_c0_g1::TRINITY_DN1197_c0_g1_i1::g.17335::m.17335 TRINITY_DN1197_c0_g1::TRINITY_DN1197_c0_g1_i1::g.17335  ORF type:complete len:144 (+),score=41.02,UBA/PF00627.26/3.8e+03,UBA/PF00627.26/1.4e+03,UBA/PF00627.26/0.0018,UBA/PF00627.26/1e+04,UBA_4/PF14555.1/0.097 TRINITY_DN1197_c0_g1_i1:36-434(+)